MTSVRGDLFLQQEAVASDKRDPERSMEGGGECLS